MAPSKTRGTRSEGSVAVKEFRDFILRGNVVDLAVAVVIGAGVRRASSPPSSADIITPLIAAIIGKPDFSALTFTINGSRFRYGVVPQRRSIAFISIADRVFFFVVKPMNMLMARTAKEDEPAPDAAEDIDAA